MFTRDFIEEMMRRAILLARRGIGRVEPNPAVGAVLVNDAGTLIAEGWHQQYGGPHAEVHALAGAGDASRGATLFVTLEPCCHYGKTPPCTNAVIQAGIRRVYVGATDPAAHANGQGIAQLRAAGIEVETGVLEAEARRLIAPFAMLHLEGRSWFQAKWAMTLDGKLASRTGHSQWISNRESRAVVHELRGRVDAIMVGIGTVLADDPLLTAREGRERTACRVILDSHSRTPLAGKLLQSLAEAPVLIVTTQQAPAECRAALEAAGAEVLIINADAKGHPDLPELAREFSRRRWTNVLVEGGSAVMGSLFDQNLIDEVHAFIAPKIVGGQGGLSPIAGWGRDCIPECPSLIDPEIVLHGDDIYVHGQVRR